MNQQTNPGHENPPNTSGATRATARPWDSFVEIVRRPGAAAAAPARRPGRPSASPARSGQRPSGSRVLAQNAAGRDSTAPRPAEEDGVDWCALWARYGAGLD